MTTRRAFPTGLSDPVEELRLKQISDKEDDLVGKSRKTGQSAMIVRRAARRPWIAVFVAVGAFVLLSFQHARTSKESSASSFQGLDSLLLPVTPLDPKVKHSERPVDHIPLRLVSIPEESLVGELPAVDMTYLGGDVRKEGLYPFENYLGNFEGSVTFTWRTIAQSFSSSSAAAHGDFSEFVIVDGGMNTGFYTLLSAVLGFEVISFDIQLDCFDVASYMLEANAVQDQVTLLHAGVWSEMAHMTVTEGCDPGTDVQDYSTKRLPKTAWPRKTHNVTTLPLASVLAATPKIVALVKLDVEGSEIAALRGLSASSSSSGDAATTPLDRIQNIMLECNTRIMNRVHVSIPDAVTEFAHLQQAGFEAYMLFQPLMPKDRWFNATYLDTVGLQYTPVHPILEVSLEEQEAALSTNHAVWKIADWTTLLTTGPCRKACNLLFTKGPPSSPM